MSAAHAPQPRRPKKYANYRRCEDERRKRTTAALLATFPVALSGRLENGKALGKRARRIDGDFVVKRLCSTRERLLATVCALRQHLLQDIFFCDDAAYSSDATRLMSVPDDSSSLLSLRAYVNARPLAKWCSPKVLHALFFDQPTQKFACKVFAGVFVRYIVGLSDNGGGALANHILIAQKPRRIVQISLDGDEDWRDVLQTYDIDEQTVKELLRAERWPLPVRTALERLCAQSDCRAQLLRYLNSISNRVLWRSVYDLVERYGLLTKVSVFAMQARLYQLRTALRQNRV
jgi:hypothetical protein